MKTEEVHRSSISFLSAILVIGVVGVVGHFLFSVFGRGHSQHFYQPWAAYWPHVAIFNIRSQWQDPEILIIVFRVKHENIRSHAGTAYAQDSS